MYLVVFLYQQGTTILQWHDCKSASNEKISRPIQLCQKQLGRNEEMQVYSVTCDHCDHMESTFQTEQTYLIKPAYNIMMTYFEHYVAKRFK